jgi:hypothetical protein
VTIAGLLVAPPVMVAENVTVKLTLVALVGLEPTRVLEETVAPETLPLTLSDSRRTSFPPAAFQLVPPLVEVRLPSAVVKEWSQWTKSDALVA